jgi:hypothetical protein
MQTALEWLIEQCPRIETIVAYNVLEQAKQMEKEQILKTSKDSYIAGYLDNQCKVDDSMNFPEEYYNETYK